MSLKPSRRLPKSLQRRPSPFSLRLARTFAEKRQRKRKRMGETVVSQGRRRLTQYLRQWSRFGRSKAGSPVRLKLFFLVGVIFLSVSGLFYILLSPALSVQTMRVSRVDARVDVEEVQTHLLPFFGKHLFFLSPQLVEHTLLEKSPELTQVVVKKVYPGALHLLLKADTVAAMVTVGEPESTEAHLPVSSGGEGGGAAAKESSSSALQRVQSKAGPVETFAYLTQRGVYLEYPFPITVETGSLLPLFLVDWAVRPTHRQKVFRDDLLQEMEHARKILEETFGHSVRFITVYLRAREFHVQTERLTLWFDMEKPLIKQIEHYRTFLRSVPSQSVEQYVDLRLHGRVVYR